MSGWMLAVLGSLVVLVVVAQVAAGRRHKASQGVAREAMGKGGRLVDVRTPGEFASGHVQGAMNLPVDDLERRWKSLEPKSLPVVVYCASGSRSHRARQILVAKGFTQVVDLGSYPNARAALQ